MGEKNFQNPRRTIEKSQFYLIEGFWCKNPQWGKSKENQKIQKWILKVFSPINFFFLFFVKYSNIFGSPRSLRSECFRNVKKSQIGACSGVPPSQHADGQYWPDTL